jgi:hypothetical protein
MENFMFQSRDEIEGASICKMDFYLEILLRQPIVLLFLLLLVIVVTYLIYYYDIYYYHYVTREATLRFRNLLFTFLF